jgi:hypothetical protein
MARPAISYIEVHIPVESIALADAVLCVDCEMVTAARNGHCPVCGCTALLNLGKVLGFRSRASRDGG